MLGHPKAVPIPDFFHKEFGDFFLKQARIDLSVIHLPLSISSSTSFRNYMEKRDGVPQAAKTMTQKLEKAYTLFREYFKKVLLKLSHVSIIMDG